MQQASKLLPETDRCVMCGLCLPHCPTYTLTRDEGESPRGRISLIQGLMKNQLELTPRLETHLDHCLTCRACEAVCPSGVRYGVIIDEARAEIAKRKGGSSGKRSDLIANDGILRTGAAFLRLYQRSGLRRLIRRSGLLRLTGTERIEAILPDIPPAQHLQEYYPPQDAQHGEVALFTGCVAKIVDTATIEAAITTLTRLGYGVRVPKQQTCCGAMHLHSGQANEARRLAEQNLAAFEISTPVISLASGCGATLKEYPLHLPAQAAKDFSDWVSDINHFLTTISWPADLRLAPLPKRVAVHDPCSLTHTLRQQKAPHQLLSRIPDIELIALPGNTRCCGAAGSYMLTQPEFADRLREEKIASLKATKPDILVTSNIGCALHLQAGLRGAGMDIEVVHPIVLLARQLAG